MLSARPAVSEENFWYIPVAKGFAIYVHSPSSPIRRNRGSAINVNATGGCECLLGYYLWRQGIEFKLLLNQSDKILRSTMKVETNDILIVAFLNFGPVFTATVPGFSRNYFPIRPIHGRELITWANK